MRSSFNKEWANGLETKEVVNDVYTDLTLPYIKLAIRWWCGMTQHFNYSHQREEQINSQSTSQTGICGFFYKRQENELMLTSRQNFQSLFIWTIDGRHMSTVTVPSSLIKGNKCLVKLISEPYNERNVTDGRLILLREAWKLHSLEMGWSTNTSQQLWFEYSFTAYL